MHFPWLTIAPRSRRRLAKTRTFRARLLGYLAADHVWELASTRNGTERPVWLAYFSTVGEAKPFTANLRAGRRATVERGASIEIPRSALHRWTTQAVPGGVVTIAYLPGLFHLEPRVPFAEDVGFVMAPARRWVDEQARRLGGEHGADAREAVRAALFAAYLDRRTPLPLLRDLRFHLDLYRAALEEPWTRDLGGVPGGGLGSGSAGLDCAIACSVDLPTLAGFLTERTSRFHREHVGTVRRGAVYPVLDLAAAGPPVQLCLDLGGL